MKTELESAPLPVVTTRGNATARDIAVAARSSGGSAFSAALDRVRPAVRQPGETPEMVRVRSGDTLTSMVRAHLDRLGRPASGQDVAAMVREVAAANGIRDVDRIFAGDVVDMSTLGGRAVAAAPPSVSRALPGAPGQAPGNPQTTAQSQIPVRVPPALQPQVQALARQDPVQPPATRQSPVAQSPVAQSPIARSPVAQPQASQSQIAQSQIARGPRPPAPATPHPVLDRTLSRAVEKGFMDAADQAPARARVLSLANTYGFDPDDFARVVLMESDGFNPKASNGRCHGIIQFCEGPNAGAASVGLAGRAKVILGKDVLAQLDLVDRYFKDTGLDELRDKLGRKVDLADLYLTVLTPVARAVRQPTAPLNIAGVQAAALHEAGDRSRPITRQSITQGLLRHANQLLADSARQTGQPPLAAGNPATSTRQILAGGAAYKAVSMLTEDAASGRRSRL